MGVKMKALLYIYLSANVQAALSCIIWVFPEYQSGKAPDFEVECCKKMIFENDVYKLTGWDPVAQNMSCMSNCIYEKNREKDTHYCFQVGGNLTAKCESLATVNWTHLKENKTKDKKENSTIIKPPFY